jgi:hypothetical protein
MEITTHARRRRRHKVGPAASLGGVIVALGLMLLIAERPAHAYIDPGSGSLIYQTALGLLLGFGFMFRRVVAGVTRIFKGRPHDDAARPEDPAAGQH